MAQRKKVKAVVLGTALTIGIVGVLMIVFVGRSAEAGKHTVAPAGGGTNFMMGAMGDARASTDTDQYIKCELVAQDNGTPEGVIRMRCTILPTGSSSKFCFSYSKALVAAAQAIGGDSYVTLLFDPTTSLCSSLTVTNSSEYGAKQLAETPAP